MDRSERVRHLLIESIEEAGGGKPTDFTAWREKARTVLKMATDGDVATLARFDDVDYSLSFFTEATPQSAFDRARERGVQVATEMLRGVLLELEVSAEAPSVDVAGLHPWVSGVAASLWAGEHRRQAVEEAARTIEIQLRAKLEVAGGTGSQLVDAFAPTAPKPGEPRLRFEGFEVDSENWRNAHQGAMHFGKGCMMRIRNLYLHGHEPGDSEALEALAALSLLARWIEEAQVVTAGD